MEVVRGLYVKEYVTFPASSFLAIVHSEEPLFTICGINDEVVSLTWLVGRLTSLTSLIQGLLGQSKQRTNRIASLMTIQPIQVLIGKILEELCLTRIKRSQVTLLAQVTNVLLLLGRDRLVRISRHFSPPFTSCGH